MSVEFIKHAFVSGELAPHLQGNTDLEKYDLGLALAYNFYVDYRGGITTRPGTEFGDYIANPDLPSKFFRFEFSPDTNNTYILLFGDHTIRFIQSNAYILQAGQVVSGATQDMQCMLTVVAHGYANGDWIYPTGIAGMRQLNNKLCVVANATTDTFKLKDYFGNYVDSTGFDAFISGGVTQRVYTVASPYAAADLAKLRTQQIRDTVRLTHSDYPVYDLVRVGHANWHLNLSEFGNKVARPTGVTASSSANATTPPGASCAYVVTAVDHDGNESVASDWAFIVNARDFTRASATYRCDWDTQPNVWYYNVYRTLVRAFSNEPIGRSNEVGYVGRAYGTTFFDQDTIPDFTKTPPIENKPFANQKIKFINVLTGGTGYSNSSNVTITSATGTGFVGFPIIEQAAMGDTTGPLVGIVVITGGQDYDADADTVVVSGGTGATFEIVTNEAEGNNPRVSAIFQQRQVYAATDNKPVTVFGGKPGMFSNFDKSSVVVDSDEYEHDIDSSVVAPIKHLVALRGGLLVMSETGIWILSGEQGVALTPKNPIADPQSYTGVADVVPALIGTDLLYIESHGYTARLLTYKDFNKVYTGEDVSYLSSHFFNRQQIIENMTYAAAPFKVVWAQRSDGSLLAFTLMYEQKVYAWTQQWTRGYFRDVITINEDGVDRTYVAVNRILNGQHVKCFERGAHNNEVALVEDVWCVDCGLSLPKHAPAADVQLFRTNGPTVACKTTAPVFGPGDVGKVLRAGGGRGTVVQFVNTSWVNIQTDRDVTQVVPFTSPPFPAIVKAGDWTLDPLVTEVSGADHLAGETVQYLADGNVGTAVVSADGKITGLDPCSRFVCGLQYVCKCQTLPLSVQNQPIEGRRKRVVGVAINRMQARGLKVGATFDTLYPIEERTFESPGQPVELKDGTRYENLAPYDWEVEAAVCIQQDYPLPATIRALVLDVEVGGA